MPSTTEAWKFQGDAEAGISLDKQSIVRDLWPHDVRIAIRAVSLNYRDLINSRRQNGRDFTGKIICSDGAGEVIAVGPAVTRVQVGDRVVGTFFQNWRSGRFEMRHHDGALGGHLDGMLAREVVLNEEGVLRFPEHLSYEQAACLPCAGLTAWVALVQRGGFESGQSVLCIGTGGVSVFALQFAVALGGKVIITSSSDDKLKQAKELGATHLINYRDKPEWDKEVWTLTGKKGVDQIIEVGGPGTLGKSLGCIAPGGHIALIGVLTGFGAPDASLFPLVGRNANLSGIYVGNREEFARMNTAIAEHNLRPVIDREFAFKDAIEALKYLESGRHFGKVVIRTVL